MRLQELYYLVRTAIHNWQDPLFEINQARQSGNNYKLKNAKQITDLLTPLLPIGGVGNVVESIFSTDETFYKGTPAVFTEKEKEKILDLTANIRRSLNTIYGMCRTLGVSQNSNGFDIKLPPDITLDELADCTSDLRKAFSVCPLFQNEGEEIRFLGVDVGSAWLTFTVVSAGAALTCYILNNLAAVVDKLMVIREHNAVCRQQEELARASKLKNDLLEKIVEANKMIIKGQMQDAAAELASARGQTEDPEAVERIRGSMELLNKWLDRGMQIYASIDAPEEAKAAFPPVERQSLPDAVVKALAGGAEESAE